MLVQENLLDYVIFIVSVDYATTGWSSTSRKFLQLLRQLMAVFSEAYYCTNLVRAGSLVH